MSKSIFLKNPKISFPNQNPRPQTIEPAPPLFLTIECPPGYHLPHLLTKILTVIKTGLEKYCSIKTNHTGVNNMWILKNSTNLLSSLSHLGVHKATSIQTFDFSTLYTSIPHDLLKSRMNSIINNAFKYKNGATRYTNIKVDRNKSYFTSDPLKVNCNVFTS